jgi:purine nucleosidase
MPRFLVDTDTAGDDVTALLIGLRWPGVIVEAITVAAGNVELDMCVRNALYTTQMAGRTDVPVFVGAARPLTRDLVTAHYVHGVDGMGNSNFPPPMRGPEELSAPRAIAAVAERCSGELEILAQAPLTNIALALREDPDLPHKVKRLWIMGGANNFVGNITPAAEFNFYVDPEAAKEVLAAGFDVTLVPWDVCINDATLSRAELKPIIEMDSELSRFYLDVNAAVWEFVRREHGVDGVSHPDAIMMAMAIDESVILESQRCFVDVETDSDLTRGYSLVDKMNVVQRSVDYDVKVSELMKVGSGEANANVVGRADQARFTEMLIEVLRDQSVPPAPS